MLLRASLTLRGIPAGERIAPALSRWQEGGWQPLDDPGSQIETIVNNDGTWTVSGPPGDYLFTAGVRDATGQPHIYCRTLTLAGDSPVELAAAMDIPFVDLPPAAWFDHPAPALLTFRAANCDYPGPLAGRRHVLAVVAPDEEPSRRMIPLIGEVVADWAQVDGCQPADISLLFSTTRPAPELSAELRRLGLRLITDPDGVALIALSSDASADVHLPIVFLVSPSGQPLLLREGYDLTIGEALRAAWARAKQTGCEDGRR